MRNIYKKPEMTVQYFGKDVITTSGLDKDETERIELAFSGSGISGLTQ